MSPASRSSIHRCSPLVASLLLALAACSSAEQTSPIDAVIGLSNGAARGFSDLGPIVRFAPSGYIDARNGGSYTGAFPYHSGDGPYEFQLRVDLAAHNYYAWVRPVEPHQDFELLGVDLAFRTEQSGATRLDNLARFVGCRLLSVRLKPSRWLGPSVG